MSAIGRSIRRIEDRALLTGNGRFAADLNREHQLHMRVVRSPVAFGRLVEVDTSDAADVPGVEAIWTAADIAELPQIDFRMTKITGMEPYRQWCLAKDYVRYVGEPVAVVFANSPYAAEDAAELVFCDIDEVDAHLEATAEPVAFMPETMPGLLTEPAVLHKSCGDLDAAFAEAAQVVELELKVGRHTGVPLETRGALAVHDDTTDTVTMYGAAKVPHYNRGAIAAMLGLAIDRVHLSEGHVGGGFGIRGELYPEDVLACYAARRLGRPVKWIEDRKEHLMAANHSRDQVYRMRAAIAADGFLLGLDVTFITDQGAYVRTHGATVSDLSAALLPGPYVIPAYRVAGHIRLTNKTPAGTYRAPGRYESTFARERLMDAIAARVGIDRLEVRRRNLIPESRIPFDRGMDTLGTGVVYDSGRYHDLLARLEAHVGWEELAASVAERRAAGEMVGLGLGYFIEKSGLGPEDMVRMRVAPDGGIRVITGAASVGQGIETAMAQICSDSLGVNMARIEIVHGQTSLIEKGMGAFASRVTVMTGSAIKIASEALIEAALEIGAKLFQVDRASVAYDAGQVRVVGSGRAMSLAQLASAWAEQGGLAAEGAFRSDHMTYPYGIHLAQVRIDPGTCDVLVERYTVAYDIGRAINPMLVEGQIVGAVAQGLGGALYENFEYDEAGQPLATSFADYLMPTALEVPEVFTLVREDAPSPINPLGVKGAGEGGITAVGAAIASAVDDAAGRPGMVTRLPITPDRLHDWLA